jgi:mono/diheme cytochrome c family protein
MFGDLTGTARRPRVAIVFAIAIAALLLASLPAFGQEDSADADAELLIQGEGVYQANCAGCHQPGGVGLAGSFPPLVGNPNVQDAEYLRTTVRNGREGEIEVLGETYNGVMPAFPTLSDADLDALVAYVQGGFQLPGGGGGETEAELPLAGTTLPPLAGMGMTAAFVIAAAIGAFVLAPRLVSRTDRISLPWLDAWLRTGIIVVYFVVATVFVPSFVLQTETVGRLDRPVQDVIGSALWLGGLAVGLLGLWAAHRDRRI